MGRIQRLNSFPKSVFNFLRSNFFWPKFHFGPLAKLPISFFGHFLGRPMLFFLKLLFQNFVIFFESLKSFKLLEVFLELQIFNHSLIHKFCCFLGSADCWGGWDWDGYYWCSCCAVVVGGEAACGCVSLGENGCGVSICWSFMTDCRFPNKQQSPDMLCQLPLLVAEGTKEVDCPLGCCCPFGLSTWLCWDGWMTWHADIWVSGMVKMYFLAAGAGCC